MESKLYWQVEESEPRNKLILIDLGTNQSGDPRGYDPLVGGQSPRRGGREPEGRTLEGGSQFPLQGFDGENQRAEEPACLTASLSRK